MKVMSPTKPTTSGARICADDQGKLMPPKVKAIVIEQVAAMTVKFPLKISSEISFVTTLKRELLLHPVYSRYFLTPSARGGRKIEHQDHQTA